MVRSNEIDKLINSIRSHPAFKSIVADLTNKQKINSLSLQRSSRLPFLAALWKETRLPIIVITDRNDRMLSMFDEASFWSTDYPLLTFPEPNPLFYEQGIWGTKTRNDRLKVLASLASHHVPGHHNEDKFPIIMTSVRGVMTRTLPLRDFLKANHTLTIGQVIQPDNLQHRWLKIGYQPANMVLEPGFISHRGGILDIWVPSDEFPMRLEFFGDEIETIRQFNPATQRTLQNIDKLTITPAKEVLPGKADGLVFYDGNISEFYLPIIHQTPTSLIDYLPGNALILLDDLYSISAVADEIEEQSIQTRNESINEGSLSPEFPIPYLTWSEIVDQIQRYPGVNLGFSSTDISVNFANSFQPAQRYGGYLHNFIGFLIQTCNTNSNKIFVISQQCSRIKDLWNEKQPREPSKKSPIFIEETLSQGFVYISSEYKNTYVLTDSEIFGWEKPKPRRKQLPTAATPEIDFTDLQLGSWVVHIDHGIGKFIGLVHREMDGVDREYLLVEYDGNDQLFVPIYQADRLTRYIGPDSAPPTVTRLGTTEWLSSKNRVRESVIDVAKDLLEIYAKRQVAQGHAFSLDTSWQQELEAGFPYVETQDQAEAIAEVKKDMESPRPMDRLLCGDVGYGKTEVALRAAFKAVMDGKQVAMLVPTTVLAQQHYDTFCQRLTAFPVETEMLSRFRTTKEQTEIIDKIKKGSIDIIIGTHRLLQSDVEFKDLGLLIIDEEQRFGVIHKEYFKCLRTEIDVLTLTATPIPRTLYMALTNVRDISNINTPPDERLPITTYLGIYSPQLVRQAIIREMDRGGQVYFVHNRVQTIQAMERHINKIVPEATIGIAHGQMPEKELAAIMHAFTRGDIDVLICTSIIESGLDIPNANTLIVDRGDTFGLAQLYQLRGRVGRGNVRAYAYFFMHRRRKPTPEGLERLEIIAENTQLGAGYSIAMRDLEMRGAGEILGTKQHGNIAAVGFQLYTRMLAQAVSELQKDREIKIIRDQGNNYLIANVQVNVDLPLSIGIPIEYISDQLTRIGLYRRLASLRNKEDIQSFREELLDRFGALPEQVENLLFQMRIKLRAENAGLLSVGIESKQFVLRFPPLANGTNNRNLADVGMGARAGKNAYWWPFNPIDNSWKDQLIILLERIAALNKTDQ